ncbi:MAG: hypothetical protein WKG06_39470 [Segetibacter sp.]
MEQKYIFIDESGDPNFYAKGRRPLWIEPDFVPVIFLGMIVTENKSELRRAVSDFQNQILKDPLFNTIYSVCQPAWHLHACQDHSDINLKMIEFLRQLTGFRFTAVIGRKIPEIELEEMEANCKYYLYLSQRQSNTEQRFAKAFEKAVITTSKEIAGFSYSCSVVRRNECGGLSALGLTAIYFER